MILPRRSRRGSAVANLTLLANHIGENKTVSLDNLTHSDWKGFVENRSGVNERMKFSVLSARIDADRQLIEEPSIEVACRKAWSETFRIHAGELRPEPTRYHVSRQVAGVQVPEREQGFQPATLKLPLAVSSNLCKKQVAESHGLHSG